jgi:hypothetical protein
MNALSLDRWRTQGNTGVGVHRYDSFYIKTKTEAKRVTVQQKNT